MKPQRSLGVLLGWFVALASVACHSSTAPDSTAVSLVVVAQPCNVVAGSTIISPVLVEIRNSANVLITNAATVVTVTGSRIDVATGTVVNGRDVLCRSQRCGDVRRPFASGRRVVPVAVCLDWSRRRHDIQLHRPGAGRSVRAIAI